MEPVTMGYLAAKSYKFLLSSSCKLTAAIMNSTCFQDAIGFIKFSISHEFLPLLMDKD